MGSLLLSSGSWCAGHVGCVLQDWSLCFPQSSGRLIIRSDWDSQSPFRISRLGSLMWCSESSQQCENFWYYCPPGCGSPTQKVWDLIFLCVIVPLLPSHCGFFFVFGHGVSLFGGFLCPPIDYCSAARCSFGALTGGDEYTSFYSAILNQKV